MTKNLIDYLLHLADSNLILAQQNAAWCGHGPILEQDIALTNITLDLIGQSRNYYQYAAELIGDGSTEDSLAYLRTERDYKNCLICEQPNGDWAQTILRQFFFSVYQQKLLTVLQTITELKLAAIAEKSLKEVNYHVRWGGEWVIRLGDGTEESKSRLLNALDVLWPYVGEMSEAVSYEKSLHDQYGIDSAVLKMQWQEKINEVFEEASLSVPLNSFQQKGGKTGIHTERLGYILSDLQYLQRTYPNAQW